MALSVAVRTEEGTFLHLASDGLFRPSVHDHSSDSIVLLIGTVVEIQTGDVSLSALRAATSGGFSLIHPPSPIFRRWRVMLLTMTVRTQHLTPLDFRLESVFTVAVCYHRSDAHFLLYSIGMVVVKTCRVFRITPLATTLSLFVVGPRAESCPSLKRAFGVPLPIPVMPPLVDGQLFPDQSVREIDIVGFRFHARSA